MIMGKEMAVEGRVDCIGRDKVEQALDEMKTDKL